jgi:hypothetical protein
MLSLLSLLLLLLFYREKDQRGSSCSATAYYLFHSLVGDKRQFENKQSV